MDAENDIGPEGVASLVPALEKMPQLTSLDISRAWIGFGLERRCHLGCSGAFVLYCLRDLVVRPFVVAVGAICGRRCATCVHEGRR
jgi:hypothetical protein